MKEVTKEQLNEATQNLLDAGKRGFEYVRDDGAKGQWKKLMKNPDFARIVKIFGIKE